LGFLDTHELKATFYILGWIAEYYPDLVKEIASRGHEIGFHSWRHRLPVNQAELQFARELHQGLDLLQSLTGKKVTTYRAPDLSLDDSTQWILPFLADAGITSSSSTRQGNMLGGKTLPGSAVRLVLNPSHSLIELPVNRLRLPLGHIGYTGSGYFRVLPSWFLRKLFRKHSEYLMAYFHPRDFDAGLPWSKGLSTLRNWKNTAGHSRTFPKLEPIVQQHTFIPVEEAVKQLQQTPLQIINL